MTYQIAYYSPEGYAQKLAEALNGILPSDTPMEPLRPASTATADVQLAGFDLKMMDLNTLPLNVSNYLKTFEGKTVLLFVTVPFQPDDVLNRQIHKCVASSLPAECDYRGMYLCPAQPSEKLLEGFQNAVQSNPSNTRAKHWLERCKRAVNRPNEQDIQDFCRFASHVLKLNTVNP